MPRLKHWVRVHSFKEFLELTQDKEQVNDTIEVNQLPVEAQAAVRETFIQEAAKEETNEDAATEASAA